MSKFVGSYVGEITDALLVSALSGQHAILLGAPGWGKTAIARSVAEQFADGQWTFTRFDPSTPVEAIAGTYDPAKMLEGELVRLTEGTPYHPGMEVAVLDEVFRANEPMFDRLLDVLDMQDKDGPTCWGTANFVAQSERTEALIDRFGLWVWITPEQLDANALAKAALVNGGKPQAQVKTTRQEIQKAREATPSDEAIAAVAKTIAELEDEARHNGLSVHPRRKVQWANILFRVTAWETGSGDFSEVSEFAKKSLRWAMPAVDAQEAANWRSIVTSIQDRVLAAIEAVLAEHVGEFRRVAGVSDPAQRRAEIPGLGTAMADAQQALASLAGDDPRVDDAIALINQWFAAAAQGRGIKKETIA